MQSKLSIRHVRGLAKTSREALRAVVPHFALIERPPDDMLQRASLEGRTVVLSKKPNAAGHALAMVLGFDDMLVVPLAGEGSAPVTCGRAEGCEVRVEDPSVSSRHALIAWSPEHHTLTLRDLGSTNGTLVGAMATSSEGTPLRDGQVVSLGDAAFVFVSAESLYDLLVSGAPPGR